MERWTERLHICDLCEADYPAMDRILNAAQKSAVGSGMVFFAG